MKQILFILGLLGLATSANAEWVLASKTDTADFYMDPNVREGDGYVYAWFLIDYLRPTEGDLSVEVYKRIDCNSYGQQWLTTIFYKRNMGRGEGEDHSPEPEWIYPNSGQALYHESAFACMMRKQKND